MPTLPDENAFPSPAGRQESTGLSRRPVLEYFTPAMVRNRVRRLFSSREKLAEASKTLAWVIPLTLLIWVYAEREQVVVPNSPNVSNVIVTITSSDKDLYVESASATPPTVNLQLTGPQQAVDKVRQLLSMRIPAGPGLTVDVGSLAVGNNQPIKVVDYIQNLEIFKNYGVTVLDSQPPELRVDVDREMRRDVPVRVPPNLTNVSIGESHFEPSRVYVSGPEKLVRQIDAVYPRLDGNDLLNQPGSHTIASASLVTLPQNSKATISPAVASSTIVVRALDVSYELPDPVPIYVQILETTLVNNDFVLTNGDSSIANVTVSGPQAMIDEIKSGKFQVKALLVVDGADTGNASVAKALDYVLPPGVKVSPADAKRTVEYKLSHH